MGLRLLWVTVLVGVALVSGLTTYGALAARFPRSSQAAFASPSPAQTASPTATATPSPSPTPSPTPAPDLTVTVKKIDVPAEFRYLIVGNAPELRLIVLDLDAKTANDVGTIHVPTTPGVQFPSISPSADGKSLLISVYLAAGGATVYLVHPDRGDSQALTRGNVVSALLSPDATRFAIGRNDADQTMTGLWIGTIADGQAHRLVADDPSAVGSPPRPLAFSPDASQLAFGVGVGDTGDQAAVVSVSSPELRVDRSGSAVQVTGGDVALLNAVSGAEFRTDKELFAWSSRSAFGGVTATYVYDIAAKRSTGLFRSAADDVLITAAAWRPGADQYATVQRSACCGVDLPQTAWLRGRDGSARKLNDQPVVVGETWWSRDGSRLFAREGADDSTGVIVDLLTGRGVVTFCLRGGGPPPAPCS